MNRQHILAATATPAMPDGFTQPNGMPAVPIVLGLVGHRDLRPGDRDVLKQRLNEIFQQFRDAYPQTPLVLLSALAEGADQLAAEAALDSGVFVRAPLPFPPEIYRQSTSFDTDDSRRRLDELLAESAGGVVRRAAARGDRRPGDRLAPRGDRPDRRGPPDPAAVPVTPTPAATSSGAATP